MTDEEKPGILVDSPLADDAHSRANVRKQLSRERARRHRRNEMDSIFPQVFLVVVFAMIVALGFLVLYDIDTDTDPALNATSQTYNASVDQSLETDVGTVDMESSDPEGSLFAEAIMLCILLVIPISVFKSIMSE